MTRLQDVRIDGEKMTAFQALLSEVLKGNYVYTYAFYYHILYGKTYIYIYLGTLISGYNR